MGWSGGSRLFGEMIDILQEAIPDLDMRVSIYCNLIPAFENEDWDTIDECMGEDPAYDLALMLLYPEDFEDE